METKVKPINVVGPISHTTNNVEDREDLFSASGDESIESDAANDRLLREELVAQKKLIVKLEDDLGSQVKVS